MATSLSLMEDDRLSQRDRINIPNTGKEFKTKLIAECVGKIGRHC